MASGESPLDAALNAALASAEASKTETARREPSDADLATLVALGRDAIGTLPYFADLGLAEDPLFLFALGRHERDD